MASEHLRAAQSGLGEAGAVSVVDAFVDEVHDGLRGSPRKKDLRNAGLLEAGNVGFGDDAAYENGHVGHAFLAEQIHQLRANGVVRAGKNG